MSENIRTMKYMYRNNPKYVIDIINKVYLYFLKRYVGPSTYYAVWDSLPVIIELGYEEKSY
jgi:hypothetical protein